MPARDLGLTNKLPLTERGRQILYNVALALLIAELVSSSSQNTGD